MSRDKTHPDRDHREQYWNEHYVAYWKARVAESNASAAGNDSSVVAGDAKSSPDVAYLRGIELLKIGSTEDVLELGCGFGRSLPALCRVALHVTAVDISAEMIAEAQRTSLERNVTFCVSSGEALPLADATFDAIVCFATFDAMYQTEALLEMSRLCRNGARVLITGKNDDYHDDDAAALAAEIGARAKGHPNYFTDVDKLLASLSTLGFQLETARYFARRGDFSRNVDCGARPARFYEYLIVLRKVAPATAAEDLVLSTERSRTFLRQQQVATP